MTKKEENIVKVIVIDDSSFMRKSLTLMLESDPEIRVIGTAGDGNEGIEKIRKLKPDIITLDIEMPGMDGLTALKIIMDEMPMPVLVVSSLTTESAQTTLKAFDLGAVDFISKDLSNISANIKNIKDELVDKVKSIARSRLVQTRFRMRRLVQASRDKSTLQDKPLQRNVPIESVMHTFQAVVVGISTGGPQALLKMIPRLPEHFPLGMCIVQHMPPRFTATLADRLNSISKNIVKEAEQGDFVSPGKILIAPGGKQMKLVNNGGRVSIEISDEPSNILYKPSADLMITSAAAAYSGPLLGIIMTGMGKDGVEGLKKVKAKGGYVLAQDEESCVVYGMPRAALEEGIVDLMQSLDGMTTTLENVGNALNSVKI